MKKIRVFALILCLLLALECLWLPVSATDTAADGTSETTEATGENQPSVNVSLPTSATFTENDLIQFGCYSPDARYSIYDGVLLDHTQAAVLYEVNSGTLVYAYNADTPLSPSSLVKIMTALIAIEQGDLSETVTATWNALNSVPMEALAAGIVGGEELTLKELIYTMMVGSANDAAAVIAEHIAGDQESFAAMMNERAAELGCTGTNFVNAHGLHDDAQVTTARDVVKILLKALEYPEFVEIFGTASYTLPATNKSEARNFSTTNYMLTGQGNEDYLDTRVTGGRTGVTDDGFRCFAATAEEGNAKYISVVLNSKPKYSNGVLSVQGTFEDTAKLLDLAFQKSDVMQILRSDAVVGQLTVQNGANDVAVGPGTVTSCVLPVDYSSWMVTERIQTVDAVLNAPVSEGQLVAYYQVWYGSICIAYAPLYAKNSVEVSESSIQQNVNVDDPGFDAGALSTALMVLGVIFAVILILFGGSFLIRTIRTSMRKNRIRKRRQARRRSK